MFIDPKISFRTSRTKNSIRRRERKTPRIDSSGERTKMWKQKVKRRRLTYCSQCKFCYLWRDGKKDRNTPDIKMLRKARQQQGRKSKLKKATGLQRSALYILGHITLNVRHPLQAHNERWCAGRNPLVCAWAVILRCFVMPLKLCGRQTLLCWRGAVQATIHVRTRTHYSLIL